jgi:endonuclease/exonuclease/phosphatase (EEP) superfamily protein YafD
MEPNAMMDRLPEAAGRGRARVAIVLWVAWAVGVITTALGFGAPFIPALDLINQCRPFAALGAIMLFAAAVAGRDWRLIRPTMALALLLVGLLLLPWARAADTAPNAAPALRLVSFNLSARNDRFDDIADFMLSSGADILLLQEVSCAAVDRLVPKLKAAYPHAFVSAESCFGQALLAKRPWLTGGQVITGARKPLFVWARFEWNSVAFDLTGVDLADPLAPNEQAADIERLLARANQGRAQVVAGTLNLTPFAWKFAQLTNAGLGQHATFLATWPGRRPLFLMDNVLSTSAIASVRFATGPALGSDHRPLIADIAFVK